MKIAHEKSGHLGSEKVLRMIKRRFMWPGMTKQVTDHCRSCQTCQLHDKYPPKKALMVERPVLTEPFQSMALDIVGPLKKGKGGCQYLLTGIYLACKWPDAIPLRIATAKSVAEAMWEVFSRTGIPEQILIDQGPQFMSKLQKELCEMLQVQQTKTYPYHPQCNGIVECMYRILKSAIVKCVERGKDWVPQVPYALFALRHMPFSNHGYTPFDLVHGF